MRADRDAMSVFTLPMSMPALSLSPRMSTITSSLHAVPDECIWHAVLQNVIVSSAGTAPIKHSCCFLRPCTHPCRGGMAATIP
jgi:hypothetical protein